MSQKRLLLWTAPWPCSPGRAPRRQAVAGLAAVQSLRAPSPGRSGAMRPRTLQKAACQGCLRQLTGMQKRRSTTALKQACAPTFTLMSVVAALSGRMQQHAAPSRMHLTSPKVPLKCCCSVTARSQTLSLTKRCAFHYRSLWTVLSILRIISELETYGKTLQGTPVAILAPAACQDC